MESQSHQEDKQHSFDSFCKKVLRNEARNIDAEEERHRMPAKPFSELSEQEMAQLTAYDEYPIDSEYFDVLGHSVAVKDETIAAAIAVLPSDRRDIILLSYFLDMADAEIADKLKLVRSTVQYRRASTLRQLKKFFEEEKDHG
jgi:DNA-directed RNA polymerase specialized sigma24 family protein